MDYGPRDIRVFMGHIRIDRQSHSLTERVKGFDV